ncbi:GPN-loop GTPase [Dillenia turbinata]|uniref:GPN-loop GTPase 2 n=1 Tax=Dillenia turbinata TaxID=194707 RepID=A0AAN8ZLN5_9MAGN
MVKSLSVHLGQGRPHTAMICLNSSLLSEARQRYECAVNIEDLVKLSDMMNEHSLGPNGGLVYYMDYLEKNIDWLESKLEPITKGKRPILVFLLQNLMPVVILMRTRWELSLGDVLAGIKNKGPGLIGIKCDPENFSDTVAIQNLMESLVLSH